MNRIGDDMPFLSGMLVLLVLYATIVQPLLLRKPELIITFYGILTILNLLPILFAYIIRFILVRRRLNTVTTWIVVFLVFSFPLGGAIKLAEMMFLTTGDIPPLNFGIVTLIMGYRILRLKNYNFQPTDDE